MTRMRRCPHFSKQKDIILKKYASIVKRIVFPASQTDFWIRASLVVCKICKSHLHSLMVCCLDCATFVCLNDRCSQNHFSDTHSSEKLIGNTHSSGHSFAVSTSFGQIFCQKCGDFFYDRRIERVRREAQNNSRRVQGLSLTSSWNPSKTETKLYKRNSLGVMCINKSSTRGLKGLVNLGNTCFMNCIIQTLLHIPMLRDYFLTDQHYQHSHPQGIYSNIALNSCIMCELARIFQQFYGEEVGPYIPHRLLNLVWNNAEHLSGYEQHDAHEFFIFALNILHRHTSESIPQKNQTPSSQHECKCIIDRLFTGQLQSDLTCKKCGRISTTVDPYWDISLELTMLPASSQSSPYSSSDSIGLTLHECLENFVRPENLHSKTRCDNCKTYEESIKQLTLRKLPIIACFHLKRFEHTTSRQKINSPIQFPEQIDLTPYTTIHRTQLVKPENASESLLTHLANRYSLIAVVYHTGTTESGHYTVTIRHNQDEWINCNDHLITRESISNVLRSGSDGYLLFYSKLFLDYD